MPVAVDKLSNRSVCTSDIDYFVDMPGQSRRLEDRDRHPPLNSDIHMTDNRPGSIRHPTCSRARKHTQFKTKGQTQFKSFDHVSVFDIYIRFFHFSAIKSDVIKYRVDQCYKHVSAQSMNSLRRITFKLFKREETHHFVHDIESRVRCTVKYKWCHFSVLALCSLECLVVKVFECRREWHGWKAASETVEIVWYGWHGAAGLRGVLRSETIRVGIHLTFFRISRIRIIVDLIFLIRHREQKNLKRKRLSIELSEVN